MMMMKPLSEGRSIAAFFVVLLALGFGSLQTAGAEPIERAIPQMFGNPRVQAFFTSELHQAGVQSIVLRYQQPNDPGKVTFARTIYLPLLGIKSIEIYPREARGRRHRSLAHEIAHARAFSRGCYGHGPAWREEFRAITRRYMTEFPDWHWNGRVPIEVINEQELARHQNASC